MKPLRRKKTCEVTHDPITGQERILELTQEEDFLSDHGSVDSAGLHQRYFRDCGCDGPIGGRCFECGAISCKSCHRRCHNCQKPICIAHSNFLGTNIFTPKEWRVVTLRVQQGKTYREIGENLGIATSTASDTFHRAKKRMEDHYRNQSSGGHNAKDNT